MRGRRQEKEEAEHSEEEEKGGGIAETLDNLTIETAGNEDEAEAAEDLKAALEIEIAEDSKERGRGRKSCNSRSPSDL